MENIFVQFVVTRSELLGLLGKHKKITTCVNAYRSRGMVQFAAYIFLQMCRL